MLRKINIIPEFNERGDLPPGIHVATIDEVIIRFGNLKSLKRKNLGSNLRELFNFVKHYAVEMYVDGSFITSNPAPKDIDLIIVFSDTFRRNIQGINRYKELEVKFTGKLHIFVRFESRPFPGEDFFELFQKTRVDENNNKHAKGIISLELKK